ncbi:unnamed protein product [Diamesa serratosioi]
MNNNERKLILSNVIDLVRTTHYKTLMKCCLEKQVLFEVMCEIIEQDGSDEHDKHTKLLEKITHRGPTAFKSLLEICKEENFCEAYKILTSNELPITSYKNSFVSISESKSKLRSNNNEQPTPLRSETEPEVLGCCLPRKSSDGLKLMPYTKVTNFHINGLEVKRAPQFGTHPKISVYNMKSKCRGIFFLVNIIRFTNQKDRSGANADHDNLVTLFRELGYTIYYYEDLTKEKCFNLLNELIHTKEMKEVNSFVLCILTHGDSIEGRTVMEFTDGSIAFTEDIIHLFSNTNCESLVHKPKVFFFPFCRGKISDKEKQLGKAVETDGKNSQYINNVPTSSDILICYGTVPGFQTHRDTETGSWYITELCKVFAEHSCDCHIDDLLKLVGANTLLIRDNGRLQVASIENRGFNKLLFFNPKISE